MVWEHSGGSASYKRVGEDDRGGGRVAGCDGACHRADGIRERRLPALEELYDLLGTLDLPLGSKLVIVGVGGEQRLHLLPVAAVEGVHLLAGELDDLSSVVGASV